MALTIRRVAPGDATAIREMYAAAIADGGVFVDDEHSDLEAIVALWTAPDSIVYVAATEQGVVGAYKLRANMPGRGAHVANATYLVDGMARGRGIGRALGEHSFVEARALGFRAMQYNLVVSTNTVAVQLWRSLGMEIVATLPGAFRHPTLGYVDAYVMYKTF